MSESAKAARPENVPGDRVVDFDLYNPPGLGDGLHEAWARLLEPGTPELLWTPCNEGHWIATRGKMQAEIFSDPERFSARAYVIPKSVGLQHQMLPVFLDPPQNQPYRTLLTRILTPRRVNEMQDRIREIAGGLIDASLPDGHCDFIADYAEQLPVQVFMGMVDLPLEDLPKLKMWTDCTVHLGREMNYEQAKRAIYNYLEPHIEVRLGSERTDVLSLVVNGTVHDRPLEHAEMLSLCMQLLLGGLDTLVNFLGFGMLFLARNPAHQRLLRENSALIPGAVDELLRRFPVVTLAREVKYDMGYDGVKLKKGDMIALPTPITGMDEEYNVNPLEVDFERQGGQHLTFGKGPHFCLGAYLARVETRITLEEWFRRIPEFEVEAGSTITFRGGLAGGVNALPLSWKSHRKGA